MTTITVYAFTMYNDEQGIHVRAHGMVPKETVEKIDTAKIIKTESKQIDDSELTQSGRYYEEEPEGNEEQ